MSTPEDQFEDQFFRKRLATAVILVVTIFVIGVLGYRLIEGWDTLDALYMTVITLATIGYGEVHTLSVGGRIFTIGLILSGLGIMGYGLGITATFIVEGGLGRMIGRRRMEQSIAQLHDHFIICGAGETGSCVIEEFIKSKIPFIVIDSDLVKLEKLRKSNVCYVQGDATKDAILITAGIEKAKGLVSTLHNDRDNLFVVLTARSLNANLRIVSRVIDKESEQKMRVAGADSVVSPNFIGGMRMASIMIRPAVVSFLDVMLRDQNKTMRVEEVVLPPGARVIGRTLQESGIVRQVDLIFVAIKQQEISKYIYNPKPETVLEANDILIVMGDIEEVLNLRKLVSEGVAAY